MEELETNRPLKWAFIRRSNKSSVGLSIISLSKKIKELKSKGYTIYNYV